MRSIKFTKMQGSGNDFVVIEDPKMTISGSLVEKICDRKFGIGADGILFIGKSKKADSSMRIFNADGSEAEMCGNGARCASMYLYLRKKMKKLSLETKAGIISAEIRSGRVKIKLTDPEDIKLDIQVKSAGKEYEVDFINTGVPHAVIEVGDLNSLPVKELGKMIRHHEVFHPGGTNVDFIKVIDKAHVFVRTYERGVEDETLACGTGSVASAIIAVLNSCGEMPEHPGSEHKVFVRTWGGEHLIVYFKILKKKIVDVWLEGEAKVVFKGEYFI
ncbi:MAG TPA: diaminopimelate epimerase [Candidatus Omnitrophota bacterium]|nr:diaminopimelate epimerase [Candidatus Omnitrophota bacterium]